MYSSYGIFKGYLKSYIKPSWGLPRIFKSLHRQLHKDYLKNYVERHLGTYPSYGIPKDYLSAIETKFTK